MKLLLTAFDPFGGSDVNPAQEAVNLVADTVAGVEIIGAPDNEPEGQITLTGSVSFGELTIEYV